MKNKFSILMIMIGLAGAGGIMFAACSKSVPKERQVEAADYTCPMHPQVHQDHPGNCPICGMTLVKVSKQQPSEKSPSGVRITPERQQLIGVKTAPAEFRPAIREIRTTGRVAFDPGLAVAQREYLEIAKNVPSLKAAARSNLRLKGMSEEEIRALETGTARAVAPTNLYLPSPGDPIWVYATLFQDEMDDVHPGDTAVVSLPSDASKTWEGRVASIDPTVDPTTRSVRARIAIDAPLRPETFVQVTLRSDMGSALVVPSSAVLDTGERKVVFTRSGDWFEAKPVSVGPKVGDGTVIKEGLSEGEEVVSGAAFLVDSESQLKAAVP